MFRSKTNTRSQQQKRSRDSKRRDVRRRLRLENLESRQLMAADLGLVASGLQSDLFSELQEAVDTRVFQAEAPLVGGQLATEPVGEIFSQVDSSLNNFSNSSTTADSIKSELEVLLAEVLRGEISVTETEQQVEFTVPLGGVRTATVDLDLGLGDRSVVDVLLHADDAVDVTLDWTYSLKFGVLESNGVSQFYVDPTSIADISVEAVLDSDLEGAWGRMGVFVTKFAAGDSSSFDGGYQISLIDPNQDGVLTRDEFTGIDVDGRISGEGQVHLQAQGEFLPDVTAQSEKLFNLAVDTNVQINYAMADVDTDVVDASGVQRALLDVDPEIQYHDVSLDLGTVFTSFINPTVDSIREALLPTKPVVDALTDPIPVVSDLAQRPVSALELAETIGQIGDTDLSAVRSTVELVDKLLDYELPSATDMAGMAKNVGTFAVNYVRDLSQPTDGTQNEEEGDNDGQPRTNADSPADEQLRQNVRDGQFDREDPPADPNEPQKSKEFFSNFGSDLKFSLLTDPNQVMAMLVGDSTADIFSADIELDFGMSADVTYPIFAGLANAELGYSINAGLDLGFGYDGQGISYLTQLADFSSQSALAESLTRNAGLLVEGLYINDHNPHQIEDGSKVSQTPATDNEQPEAYLTLGLTAGASVGPSLAGFEATAGLAATLEGSLLVDLNDLPNTKPIYEWADASNPEYPQNPADWVYDGKVRVSEIDAILAADPMGMFNLSGEIDAGLTATLTVESGGTEILNLEETLVEGTIANFNFYQVDDAAIVNDNAPAASILGEQDPTTGAVTLYLGDTAHLRRNTGAGRVGRDNVTNELVTIHSLGKSPGGGESVRVTLTERTGFGQAPGVFAVQEFHNVTRLTGRMGAGNDGAVVRSGVGIPVYLHGEDGQDQLSNQGGTQTYLYGGDHNDELLGGPDRDRLYGEGGNDVIRGGGGYDVIYGGEGNDFIQAGAYTDYVSGGGGEDQIFGDDGSDTLRGDAGNDTIHGDSLSFFDDVYAGNDYIFGGSGEDNLNGGNGHDRVWGDDGNDEIRGGTGNDRLYGGQGEDTVLAGNGNDYVRGDDGNDTLYGGNDNDTIYGDAGEDTLRGEYGNDYLDGGVGNDNLKGANGDDRLYGQGGADTLDGDNGNDHVNGGSGDDTLYGGYGNDTLNGSDGVDALFGEYGNDWLYGGNHNDRLYGSSGSDYLSGQGGTDWLYGGSSNDTLRGGDQNDFLYGEDGHDTLYGDNHNDHLDGGNNNDTLYGGSGNDTLHGKSGDDTLKGDSGDDRAYGGDGVDRIWGGSGHDRLYGQFGNDFVYGDSGNDLLEGDLGNDYLDGGADNDTVYGHGGNDTIKGGSGADHLQGHDGHDTIHGGDHNDKLIGDGGRDTIYGDGGNDTIFGDSEVGLFWDNDVIYGGSGNDVVYAGAGHDKVWGDNGHDTLRGEGGNDELHGGNDNDTIYAGEGNDSAWGDAGHDHIRGEAGSDYLRGGSGNDYIYGETPDVFVFWGNDTLYGDSGADHLYGNHGNDTLYGGDHDDYLNGGEDSDHLYGQGGNDYINPGEDWLFAGAHDGAWDYADGGSGWDWVVRYRIWGVNQDSLVSFESYKDVDSLL